jgi:cell division initiation protein
VKVTPLDIRRKEFKRSMRGYSDEEVDLFLDEVADEFERLFQENIELQERVQRLEEQMAAHAQLREALEKTLITAQLQADEIKANARKESELILRDAELKARDILGESYKETQRVQQALIQLKRLEEDFRFKFRSLLEGHLKLLEEAPIGVPQGAAAGRVADGTGAAAGAAAAAAEAGAAAAVESAAAESTALAAEVALVGTAPEQTAAAPAPESVIARESGAETPSVQRWVAQEAVARGSAVQEAAPPEVASQEPARAVPEQPAQETTSEQPAQEAGPEEPAQEAGFVFGRRLDDLVNGFFVPETGKDKSPKDRSRDFEW